MLAGICVVFGSYPLVGVLVAFRVNRGLKASRRLMQISSGPEFVVENAELFNINKGLLDILIVKE
jgi:hypothetical protein